MKERIICTKCQALLAEDYEGTPLTGRSKQDCENCKKRGYACKCRIEKKVKPA